MTGWRDAYDAQMGLWRWLRSPDGRWFLSAKYRQESQPLRQEVRDMLARMFGSEEGKLLGADPIFVSSEMCELVAAAADPNLDDPFRPEPLWVTDIPTACGFLYFETPFEVVDRFERPVKIRAFAWTPLLATEEGETPESIDVEAALRRWNDSSGDGWSNGAGIALSIYDDTDVEGCRARGINPPPLELLHVTPWHFGMTFDGNEVDENDVPTGAEWWWRIVQVTFRLMQQQIAAKASLRGERSQRRQAKRWEFPERETVVVRLRRERHGDTQDEHGPANYSHRFIVSGHWRNQWFPKSQEHRQIWISPYVKGGEDLPLVIRPRRAMVWDR